MTTLERRTFLTGAAASLLPLPAVGQSFSHPFTNGGRPLVTLPGKRPLIALTLRPPQVETPFGIFNDGILTPNDAFFVRYHLSGLPQTIDTAGFRLSVQGAVNTPLSISLASLRRDFPVQEIVAVNQCSGNSRGFFEPRVGGGQLGNGAMGNARWTGVSLKAVLDKAGLAANARQVSFNGLDSPPVDTMPDFIKALNVDHARDGEVMIAYAMNGEDLPFLNGYPMRLIVPGYYGTYWIKHLSEITVLPGEFDGYWMKTAYRVPDNECACVEPGGKPDRTRPISRMNVRSFVTSHADGSQVRAGTVELRGIAFSGGAGISRVLVSANGSENWQEARLGSNAGQYSFREWRLGLHLPAGRHTISVRAADSSGQSQPLQPVWQPAGYMRNAVETIRLEALA